MLYEVITITVFVVDSILKRAHAHPDLMFIHLVQKEAPATQPEHTPSLNERAILDVSPCHASNKTRFFMRKRTNGQRTKGIKRNNFV